MDDLEIKNRRNKDNTKISKSTVFDRLVCNYGVVVLGFNVSLTAKVIQRRDLGLKSHPKDWRSPGLNSRPLD